MGSFLEEVIANKKAELAQRKEQMSLSQLSEKIAPGAERFRKALASDGLKIIAELKPRSPSVGVLDEKADQSPRLEIYDRYASAVSVLCDQRYFGGSVEMLAGVSASISAPTLLKDFVIDQYQVYEGRKAGAEAVLLIVKILDDSELLSLRNLILSLKMEPIIEVQTEEELRRAEAVGADYILINNRNLDNLKIDLKTVEHLVSKSKDRNAKFIAASGIETAQQMLDMRPFASRFLIGSALMSSGNLEEKFEEFLSVENSYMESSHR